MINHGHDSCIPSIMILGNLTLYIWIVQTSIASHPCLCQTMSVLSMLIHLWSWFFHAVWHDHACFDPIPLDLHRRLGHCSAAAIHCAIPCPGARPVMGHHPPTHPHISAADAQPNTRGHTYAACSSSSAWAVRAHTVAPPREPGATARGSGVWSLRTVSHMAPPSSGPWLDAGAALGPADVPPAAGRRPSALSQSLKSGGGDGSTSSATAAPVPVQQHGGARAADATSGAGGPPPIDVEEAATAYGSLTGRSFVGASPLSRSQWHYVERSRDRRTSVDSVAADVLRDRVSPPVALGRSTVLLSTARCCTRQILAHLSMLYGSSAVMHCMCHWRRNATERWAAVNMAYELARSPT